MKPKLGSFRLRIALLSTVLSGGVLVAFSLWAWDMVERMGLQSIDETIWDVGYRTLAFPSPLRWEGAAKSLEFALGNPEDESFILMVKGRDDRVEYGSPNWPRNLPAEAFPNPQELGFQEMPKWDSHFRIRRGERGGDRGIPAPPAPQVGVFFGPPDGLLPDRAPGAGPRRGMPPLPPRMPVRAQRYFTHRDRDRAWRIGVVGSPEATFVLGLNLSRHAREMERLRWSFAVAVPAALLLIGLGGWWLAQRALRPVRALTVAAEGITARDLEQRIPVGGEDVEFDRLIRVFNGMLDRLDKSFKQAVRFSADAAHELKTPLTILQGELEQAVQEAEGAAHGEAMGRLLQEVQRLKSITRKLLLLSLADSGRLRPHVEPVNLSELVEGVREDTEILGPELQVEAEIEPGLWTPADPDLIRQMIQNLTSNAVKYNVVGGRVRLELKRNGDWVTLRVGNTGPGIPPEDWGRVFDRFYRADKARNRRVDGVGLGLSLARELARAHGGDLLLEDSQAGWTSFVATAPLHRPAPEAAVTS